jgi:D-alanine-D-alanine ligase
MRIAFTHDLQRTDDESEAEFDRPETVAALSDALASLGHVVEPVEVGVPVPRLVERLLAAAPDLVFNTAEGRHGRAREAFYPALFEQLGLPFTGSDAHVCTVTLDKWLTKRVVGVDGVPTPRARLIRSVAELERGEWAAIVPPCIVKPNFEGSSKGITDASVVREGDDLAGRVRDALARYPDGVLVEAFARGRDVVVPYLAGATLPATGYRFLGAASDDGTLYDYQRKNIDPDAVEVVSPADLSPEVACRLQALSTQIFRRLDVRDMARIDWRVRDDGEIAFLEINALPSLEPGAGIYASAAAEGMPEIADVLGRIVESAARRYGLLTHRTTILGGHRGRAPARVGLVYNLKRVVPQSPHDDDRDAEFDAPATIDAIAGAIEAGGHTVVRLEATPALPIELASAAPDVVFNIAEGVSGGRNREAQVPALLEMAGVPYSGSDAATLSLALDKGLAKRVVRQAGVRTPDFVVFERAAQRVPRELTWPLILKPVAEGSSKGVLGASVVEDEEALRERLPALFERYRQPVLAETFLPGREFTVALLGGLRPQVLPPMEVVFSDAAGPHPVYGFAEKLEEGRVRFDPTPELSPALRKQITGLCRRAWRALGCRDVARIDIRLDREGRPNFIECNPLPGLTPGWSDLCVIAEAAGIDYQTLIARILAPALRRMRAARRAR